MSERCRPWEGGGAVSLCVLVDALCRVWVSALADANFGVSGDDWAISKRASAELSISPA